VLPAAVASDPERLARFQREAEVLAALNHPNIAHIHGLENSDGNIAIVMELVEGHTIADRIAQGAIPLDEALPIATQIAEALEAAHERGIIHRDLKPANIKLRPDGTVKVLDFGLAKPFEQTTPLPGDLTQSPTVLSPAPTLAGVLLGTAAYMSPEQARGKAVDKRTDVWAFGCVLFEMLTGKKPFEGDTLADAVAAIVKNEPDWRALPTGTPATVQSVIARCLRKDPAQRLHDIADGRFQIEEALNNPVASAPVIPVRRHREWAGWIVAALSLGAAAFLAARPSIDSRLGDAISVSILPPEKTAFSGAINTTVNVPSFAVAPDGRAVVFSAETPGAKPMLWVRSMDRVGPRQLAGTEDAQDPFWSPDSRWIAFFANGELKKIPAAGGAVQVVTQTLDLTAPGLDSAVEALTDNREIGLLVCNAGATHGVAMLLDRPVDAALALVRLNCVAPLVLSHAVGAQMRTRGRGGVILVSSMAGLAGGAFIAAYAASKAFEIVLAESLWYEFGTAGVDVLGLIAGATATPAMLRSGMIFGTPDHDAARAAGGPATSTVPMDPDQVVREALEHLGQGPIHVAGDANRQAASGLRSAAREQVVAAMSAAVAGMYGIALPARLP